MGATLARETSATVGALGAYLLTALPQVRRELRRWRRRAAAIAEPEARRGALRALDAKSANVEAVGAFATLSPLLQRARVIRAIAPLQIAIDYRDDAEEGLLASSDEPYLADLDAAWRRELQLLPAGPRLRPAVEGALARCAEGQARTHAAERGDLAGLRRWGEELSQGSRLRWWESAAGASSSVAAHALVAVAADPASGAELGARVDSVYGIRVGALTVLLDDFVDAEADAAAGRHSYVDYYDGATELAERLAAISREALAGATSLPGRDRHRAIIAGIAGFYLSARGVGAASVDPVSVALEEAIGPSVRLIAATMAARRRFGTPKPGAGA